VEENSYEIIRRKKVDEAVTTIMKSDSIENKIYQGISRDERFTILSE